MRRSSLTMGMLGAAATALAAIGISAPSGHSPKSSHSATAETYIHDLAGVAMGAATPAQRRSNSLILNAHLARGEHLKLRAGERLEIGSGLKVGSGGSISGDAGGEKPIIYMAASAFNNSDDAADRGRYARNAVGIDFSGDLSGALRPSAGVLLKNLRIVSEQRQGRRLRAIVGRNVTGCTIRNVEISGFPIAIGIALASARQCRISNIFIHDFNDNSAWAQLPQSTGIEIDNDPVGGIGSSDNSIDNFRISRLRLGSQLLAKWGYQTDGINILSTAVRTRVADGQIDGVGEGIDTFGVDGTISNVTIANTYNFGLKFIHGAAGNRVNNVTITNPGLAGVTFSGSDVAVRNTADNVLSNIRISDVDPDGAWRGHSTAGILISGRNSRRVPVNNRVVDAEIDLGPHGQYGWLDDSTGAGNRGERIHVRSGPATDRVILVMHKGSSVALTSNP